MLPCHSMRRNRLKALRTGLPRVGGLGKPEIMIYVNNSYEFEIHVTMNDFDRKSKLGHILEGV